MLAELHIQNFAIIDKLSVSFDPGMTVITGETGAGKSILVNAINLLLGSRGSAELIRSGSKEATVSALFNLPENINSTEIREAVATVSRPELLVQRTLSTRGRNRVYINDQFATVGSLGGLCQQLVSISGQHEHQLFLKPEAHLEILDRYGGLRKDREAYGETFVELKRLKGELRQLKRQARERWEKKELSRFQLEEINKSRVQMDEELQLVEEREILRHAESLRQGAGTAHQALYAESGAVLEEVKRCQMLIADLGRLDESLKPVAETLEQIRHQVEDVSLTLRDYSQRIQADPARLQWVEDRLHTLKQLMRKYGGSTREVIAQAGNLQRELDAAENDETEITGKEKALELIEQTAVTKAVELSKKRRRAAIRLGEVVEKSLVSVDMPDCRFSVQFDLEIGADPESERVGEYLLGSTGVDRGAFFFSANPGEDPRAMAKIASGGELSRIVLTLKELLARETDYEALVFDEVDAGIGGRTADRVGQRLKTLARRHQLICITHLPQIACYADHHYVVRKSTRKGRTITGMKKLAGEERLEEVARLLGGTKISTRTRAHAREMLEQAQKHDP